MLDEAVNAALARSFLAKLPAQCLAALVSEGERNDYPAVLTLRTGDACLRCHPTKLLRVDGVRTV
jgi:hypothetical protein